MEAALALATAPIGLLSGTAFAASEAGHMSVEGSAGEQAFAYTRLGVDVVSVFGTLVPLRNLVLNRPCSARTGARLSERLAAEEGSGLSARTPVGRTGSWTDTSQITGNNLTESRGLNVAGAESEVAPINEPATINGRDYSGHALDRMQGRGYVPLVVEDAIQNDTGTPSYGGATAYYSRGNNITVIVNQAGKVVTVRGGAP